MAKTTDSHRVLVAGDDPTVVDVISVALRLEGFTVHTAASGSDALARLREFDPELYVLEVMRRQPFSRRLRFEDLMLDDDSREVVRGEQNIELTATEYRLLHYLMRNPGRVLTRAQILEYVWAYDFGGDARVLETYISYLRKKLGVHGPPLIHTVRGVGYVLRAPRP